ncbi:MAG: glycosyl hydrolase family 8 [Chloroflexota bacterium]|nr:glycosyl hydrolase family 8 [Chloroflexota bacterium]
MARVIRAPTRTLGTADPRALLESVLRRLAWIARGEGPVLLGLAVLALVSHGLNMFQYPSFTGIDDEGIYAAQAWAVLREGLLSPYTYVYDHVPGGWILVALWMALTGGPHVFGSAIDSGRALMLLLHVAALLMVYRVARKLGCGVAMAALAGFLFTVSPLALPYQRRLLLDNIMLFWCLLSLDLLLDGWGRLSRVTISGICFGVAMLTKETAVFLLPPMLYIAWQQRWQHQARFAVVGWLVPLAVVVSWYPLYAALKGELLPAGAAVQFSTSGYGNTGVSLIDALVWQIGRDGGGPFNVNNQFWSLIRSTWLPADAVLLVGGALAALLNLARGWRGRSVADRRAVATGLLGLLPLLYLARGGIVFDFYILAAAPFLCLNLAVLLTPLAERLPRPAQALAGAGIAGALIAAYVRTNALTPLYTQAPSTAGRQAIAWMKAHVPADARIVTRDDLWTDLREVGSAGPGFQNVHSYTKLAGDPAIRTGVFADDWRNVDYLVMSPGLEQMFADSGNTLATQALEHAHSVKSWTSDGSSLAIWKVDKSGATEAGLLSASAAYIDHHFDRAGAFAAPDGTVTSEAEAYALLRAVWSGDRDTFQQTWQWSKAHLLNSANGLPAWKWNATLVDPHSAADADTDMALALLMAGRRWANPEWEADGTRLAQAIWDHDVARAGGAAYVSAGDWAPGLDVVPVNPSYFAPYAYHVFQEVDPGHDWLSVIDSGYQLLFDSSAAALGEDHSAGLPPDWIGIHQSTGQPLVLTAGSDQTSVYGYDAPRTYWRIALDLDWHSDGRAAAYLAQAGFLRDEVARTGRVRAVYTHAGAIASEDTSIVSSAGALSALLTLDPGAANALYADQLLGGADYAVGEAHWGNADDLYAQEWGWFATALYAHSLTDVWHADWPG